MGGYIEVTFFHVALCADRCNHSEALWWLVSTCSNTVRHKVLSLLRANIIIFWKKDVPLRNLGASLASSVRLTAIFCESRGRNIQEFTSNFDALILKWNNVRER